MNDKTREKLANRTAYAILAILMVAALTVTVIAIVTTVNKRNQPEPPIDDPSLQPPADDQSPTDNDQPSGDTGNGGAGDGDQQTPPTDNTEPPADNTQPPADTKPEDTPKEPEKQVFVLPSSGYVTKGYAEDTLVFSPTMNDYRVHLGVDIAGQLGDPVYAFCEGTVKEVFNHPFMGMTVVLSHANGIESKYMNLSSQLPENIKVGATVAVGSVIGAIGETALMECADAPHLHFEVFANGKQVSPSGYVTFNTDTPTGGEE